MSVDPVTTQVIISRFKEVATRMAHALYHSGFSPILRESKDGTAGLTDAAGNVLAIGGGLQYHLLTYRTAVQAVLQRYPLTDLAAGDVFIANDPYEVGTGHTPDVVAIGPIFHADDLIGFGVSIAHKSDVGGIVPGSCGTSATEIFHDGLRLGPVRFRTKAGFDDGIERIIRSNSRSPESVIGDLRGQVGATRIGAVGLEAIWTEYGPDVVKDAMDSLLRLSAKRLADEIGALADGEATVDAKIDYPGADEPIVLQVRLQKADGRLLVDFSGTSDQVLGPLNAVPTNICSAALIAIVATLDPSIPINGGLRDPVQFRIPTGSVIDPEYPASVNGYALLVHAVYTVVLSAIGELKRERAVAPAGLGIMGLAVGYERAGRRRGGIQYELVETSLGATSRHDGVAMSGMINHYMAGTSVEVLENEYPMMVRRFDLRPDSAGAGTYRGGVGYIREYEFLESCTVTVRWANREFGSWGVRGGTAPAGSDIRLRRADGAELSPSFDGPMSLDKGDVLAFHMSGGGGFGPAALRPVERVVDDVLDGYVSVDAARDAYGVLVDVTTRTGRPTDERNSAVIDKPTTVE